MKQYSLGKVAAELGIKKQVLEYFVETGEIILENGRINKETYEKLKKQKETYKEINGYFRSHKIGLFDGTKAGHRDKLLDYLEINEYFGVERIDPDGIFLTIPNYSTYYFTVDDAAFLDYKCAEFFSFFGLTEYEKTRKIIQETPFLDNAQLVADYLKALELNESDYTGSYTDFVSLAVGIGDISKLTMNEAVELMNSLETKKAQEIAVDYLNYVRSRVKVCYGEITRLKEEHNYSEPAYGREQFLSIICALFNKTYAEENYLWEKALDSHVVAESWLFLSAHFVKGLRQRNICNAWVYPWLSNDHNPFNINLETIREDVLNDRIKEETYIALCEYVMQRILVDAEYVEKTGVKPGTRIQIEIVPELRGFFGKLILIAEYHHLQNNEGYMKSTRCSAYCNWTFLKDVFGEKMFGATGKCNIHSRRLTKSIVQGLIMKANKQGLGPVEAQLVASWYRIHIDPASIFFYIDDHGLDGKSASVVLHMMLQEGVLSAFPYMIISTALPDAVDKLTEAERSKVISMINGSTLELELDTSIMLAKGKLKEEIQRFNVDEATDILVAMYEMCNGRGCSKSKGIGCIDTAMKKQCSKGDYRDCIETFCPQAVFTVGGINALIDCVRHYQNKLRSARNGKEKAKYSYMLKEKVWPYVGEILNRLRKQTNMSSMEWEQLRLLMGKEING